MTRLGVSRIVRTPPSAGIQGVGLAAAFSGVFSSAFGGGGVHGLDERIRVKVLYDSRDYLYRLMKI
jgi:hypothetical protein